MTILLGPLAAIRLTAFGAVSMQQNCHPDRSVPGFPATRNTPAATCAAFSKESRMKFANATNLHRKSGVAQWRDLLFYLYDWADWGCCWPTRPGAGGLGAAGFLGGSAFLPGARMACSVVPSMRGMNSTMPASPIS